MGIGRKRRRGGGELGRVAEIVMVLAAAGEARGGRAPTAAERALAADARGALAAVVGGEVEVELLRPRELFTTEAVRALVQDLGLARARDPAAVGFRPRKASIAERVLLTKRKMEEVKEALVPSITLPRMTPAWSFQIITGSPRNLSTPVTSSVISKQPMLNGSIAGTYSIKSPDIPSAVSLPPIGSAGVEMEIVVNGSNFTQNGATTATFLVPSKGWDGLDTQQELLNQENENDSAETIEQSNKSGHQTANSSNQSSLQSSSRAEKSVDEKGPAICPGTGSVVMGYQAPKEELSVQKQIIFSNHRAIAKSVVRILCQPANHPSWSVPSTEYMNKRLDCQICKVPIINMESLLVCDACERGAHVKCLQYYGNQGLQKPEWYCLTCVLYSKGKPLPPKYGKVTRTIVVPNTCITNGAQPSQVATEKPTEKDGRSDKNVAANGSVINQNTNKVGNTVCKSGTLALDATGSKSPSADEPRKEDVKHDETSSVEKEGNGVPSGGIHTETATLCNKAQSSGASTDSSGNLSEGSHMYIEGSSLSPVNYSILQSTALSGVKHADHSSIVFSVENCQSIRAPTDELYPAEVVTNNGMRNPHKHEMMANDAISDHDNAHQMTLNGHLCSNPKIVGGRNAYEGSSTASIFDWVGDGLKSIDNKTYYNSCNIDGVIYNLHDHMLITSEGGKFGPCKLQSLWEEHDSGSRLAMVNPYIFGSDIPGSISKPCIDEEDEVYGSNNDRIVLVSAIHGPCEVLHVDKFREETRRRCQLDSSGCVLHPIFFCRWNYDDSTSSFYKDYNVDN